MVPPSLRTLALAGSPRFFLPRRACGPASPVSPNTSWVRTLPYNGYRYVRGGLSPSERSVSVHTFVVTGSDMPYPAAPVLGCDLHDGNDGAKYRGTSWGDTSARCQPQPRKLSTVSPLCV